MFAEDVTTQESCGCSVFHVSPAANLEATPQILQIITLAGLNKSIPLVTHNAQCISTCR